MVEENRNNDLSLMKDRVRRKIIKFLRRGDGDIVEVVSVKMNAGKDFLRYSSNRLKWRHELDRMYKTGAVKRLTK